MTLLFISSHSILTFSIISFNLTYFYRIIQKQSAQKEILDGCDEAIDYIAKRLNWDDATKVNVLKSYPSIAKCNVAKVRINTFKLYILFTLIHRSDLTKSINFLPPFDMCLICICTF